MTQATHFSEPVYSSLKDISRAYILELLKGLNEIMQVNVSIMLAHIKDSVSAVFMPHTNNNSDRNLSLLLGSKKK